MKKGRPLILVTNDDGVAAAGLRILRDVLATLAEVIVCAPREQQSAVGHGITIGEPLRACEIEAGVFAITGRPADSVFLGLSEFCPRRPDLIVSGINHGPNLGVDVLYSGTVAAATEGAMRGIPALAVSQVLPPDSRSEGSAAFSPWHGGERIPSALEACLGRTARFAARVALAMLDNPPPDDVTINLNGPVVVARGYSWTRLARQAYIPSPVKGVDPRGIPYYWVSAERVTTQPEPGTDIAAVLDHQFSLSALALHRGMAWQDGGTWALELDEAMGH